MDLPARASLFGSFLPITQLPRLASVPRDAFPEYDEPVNIDMEPEEALRVLLDAEDEDEPPDGSDV